MLKLVDFPEDLVLAILSSCDVVSILKLEQTCKYLKRLALSRQLWMILVQDLDYDHAPNLLPHESVQSLTTERLRETVVRSTRGYLNWTSSLGPKVTRSLHLEVPELDQVDDFNDISHMLVSGGKYLIFQSGDGCFHCYDMQRQLKVCSYIRDSVSSWSEFTKNLESVVVDDGAVLVLAIFADRKSDAKRILTVARIDLESGTTRTVFSVLLPKATPEVYDRINFTSELSRLRIGHDTVVSWSPGSFVVGNWRTGESAIVEEHGDVQSIDIVANHILCTIRPVSGGIVYAAAPISLIFSMAKELSSDPSSPVTIRSEDVFIHVSSLDIPDVKGKTALPVVDLVSVCSSSWKYPNFREFDAQVVSTRILLSVRLFFGPEIFYVIFHFDFSPTTVFHTSPALGDVDDAGSGYLLTCQQRSPLYCFDEDFPDTVHLSSASRTGRAVGSFVKFDVPVEGRESHSYFLEESTINSIVSAINMHDLLRRTPHEVMGQKADHPRVSGDIFAKEDEEDLIQLNVEEYSGAVWYRRGKSVFMHYFD